MPADQRTFGAAGAGVGALDSALVLLGHHADLDDARGAAIVHEVDDLPVRQGAASLEKNGLCGRAINYDLPHTLNEYVHRVGRDAARVMRPP